MAEKKNLCAPISIELHARVREEQEQLGQTLGEYVEQVLREQLTIANVSHCSMVPAQSPQNSTLHISENE